VRLATDERQAAGVLIQRLPDRTESREDAWTETAWRDAQSGICAVGRGELLSQPLEQMLVRHFGQCDVRVFAGTTVRFECRCNRPRVARLLRSLGAEEVRDVLAERGCVTVTCDFCNRPYRFDAIDVEQLLAAGAAAQAPSSVQ
jgi:molecular chaperone Hsp33